MSSDSAAGRLRCSFAADERGDPLAGTAAHAKGFVLIESPGVWGQNALGESRLEPEIAAILATRAAAVSYRVLLIKKPGRTRANAPRRWFVVDSTPGAEAAAWGTLRLRRRTARYLARGARRWQLPSYDVSRLHSRAPRCMLRATRQTSGCQTRRATAEPRLGVLPHRRATGSHPTCSYLPKVSTTVESTPHAHTRSLQPTSTPKSSSISSAAVRHIGRSFKRPNTSPDLPTAAGQSPTLPRSAGARRTGITRRALTPRRNMTVTVRATTEKPPGSSPVRRHIRCTHRPSPSRRSTFAEA